MPAFNGRTRNRYMPAVYPPGDGPRTTEHIVPSVQPTKTEAEARQAGPPRQFAPLCGEFCNQAEKIWWISPSMIEGSTFFASANS